MKSRYFLLGMLVAAVALIADQASKWALMDILRLPEAPIDVLPFFRLVMVWNQGVSFGMFADAGDMRRWVLIGVSLTIVCVLLAWLWRAEKPLIAWAIGLIIGGAVGNVVDRGRWGAVADFFYFHYEQFYWPAFNIADSTIFIGVVLLCWDSIVLSKNSDSKAL